jgi:hypothetical protein
MKKNLVARMMVATLALIAPVLCHAEAEITRAEVYAAVKSAFGGTPLKDLKFGPGQLIMPGTVIARTGMPSLRVLQATINPHDGVVDVRLDCERYGCFPFYVGINAGFKGSQPSDIFFSWTHGGPVAHSNRALERLVLRQGDSARLAVQEVGVRMSVPVVCLQPGAVGQVIRVRIVGTNRVTNAYVKSPSQLLAVAAPARPRR